MKKIMFNDSYGLTKAVLEGRKTMTRRVFKGLSTNYDRSIYGSLSEGFNMMCSGHVIFRRNEYLYRSTFKVGEVVAIAQNYNEVFDEFAEIAYIQNKPTPDNFMAFARQSDVTLPKSLIGWNNKMFVKADLMPHHVRITNVRVERLQDISDEDCLKEGVFLGQFHTYSYVGRPRCPFNTPRDAFASLIDRISGKGTWASNPWVFVYEFELVK